MTASVYPAPFTPEFLLAVSMGLVPGHSLDSFTGESAVIDNLTFKTMWDITTAFVWPTGNETWEVLSDDINDDGDPASTGALIVAISGLDANFEVQTELKTMNGTTPVVTTRTDWNMIRSIAVVSSGSSFWNEGTITLRVSGGGATRATILPTFGRSFNGMYKVPAAKTAFILAADSLTAKGDDITIRNRIRADGTNTWLSGGDGPTYQSQSRTLFAGVPRFPAKTELEVTAISTNAVAASGLLVEVLLVDTTLIAAASASIQGF